MLAVAGPGIKAVNKPGPAAAKDPAANAGRKISIAENINFKKIFFILRPLRSRFNPMKSAEVIQ